MRNPAIPTFCDLAGKLRRAFLLAVWAVASTAGAQVAGTPADEPTALPRRITQAAFSLSEQGPWASVALPDTWTLRGVQPRQRGVYRARIVLDQRPTEVWALRASRLQALHRIRLNGHLVQDSLADRDLLRRPLPTLLVLPPALWLDGPNELEIVIDAGARAGLSDLWIGPEAALREGFSWTYHASLSVPQLLNAGCTGIAVFMLLLWWRRRSDRALGSFAALCLLTSVRNQGYFLSTPIVTAVLTDWLFFMAQTATVILLGHFALHFSGLRWNWFQRALTATTAVLPAAGLLAASLGAIHLARAWFYPWLLGLSVPAIILIVRRSRSSGQFIDKVLVASLGIVMACGTHDYLYQEGRISIMHTYWMPYGIPVVLAVFSSVLLQRLAAALQDVETLNTALEGRVAERTRELREAIAVKDRFLAVASHDLRQPLVSIGLLGGILRERLVEPSLRSLLDRMQTSVRGLEHMMKRLLDLSRLESGKVVAAPRSLALRELLQRIVEDHQPEAHAKGLRLGLRCAPLWVHADPMLLEQTLRNLVGNAVKHTPDGGVLIAARWASDLAPARIEVWDTGPGIRAEDRERLFQDFEQGGPAPRQAQQPAGVGLGLSIVRRATSLMGMSIELHSRPGRGSVFRVRVPRASAPSAHAERPDALAPAPVPRVPGLAALSGRRLWVLEDKLETRQATLSLLMHWGADVRVFANLGELRTRMADASGLAPHALLADLHLPDGTLRELLSPWRRRFPLSPVLIMSGQLQPGDAADLLERSAAVLPKPFGPDALKNALQQAWA